MRSEITKKQSICVNFNHAEILEIETYTYRDDCDIFEKSKIKINKDGIPVLVQMIYSQTGIRAEIKHDTEINELLGKINDCRDSSFNEHNISCLICTASDFCKKTIGEKENDI